VRWSYRNPNFQILGAVAMMLVLDAPCEHRLLSENLVEYHYKS